MRLSRSLTTIAVILLVIAAVAVIENRASAAIVGAALSTGTGLASALALVFAFNRPESITKALATAALPAATGLLSALTLVFVFNRPASITSVFPVSFAVERASFLPIVIPDRPFPFSALTLPANMRQLTPKTFEPPKDGSDFDVLPLLYHEFLQKMFVDDLAFHQFGTWRMKTERFVDFIQFSATPDASTHESTVLKKEELEKAFGANRFAPVHTVPLGWALPPGTELSIDPPKSDPQLGEVGTIRLKNRFCSVSIRTFRSNSMVGLGKYTPLLGISIDDAQKRFMTLQYITRIQASFNWLLVGHPDMPLYREWVTSIVDELSFSFDEDSLWSRTRDSYLLRQHFRVQYPSIQLGPIGVPPLVQQPPAK